MGSIIKILIKATINIILAALFAGVACLFITSLLAEIKFDRAQKFVSEYRWQLAEKEFKEAIRLNPYNSKYPSAQANFLSNQVAYLDDKVSYLRKIEELYGEALKLSPRMSDYAVRLGQAQLMLYLQEKTDTRLIENAFNNFRKAVQNDPNGFNPAYMAGYAGISVWEKLNEEDRKFILDRLRYAIKIKPYYSVFIYSKLWKYANDFAFLKKVTPETLRAREDLYAFLVDNDLWQFRREESEAVDLFMEREDKRRFEREKLEKLERLNAFKKSWLRDKKISGYTSTILQNEWRGKDISGNHDYLNGQMYWNGDLCAVINSKSGESNIAINAKRIFVIKPKDVKNPKLNPYMIVSIDGEVIGETFVDNDEWKEYRFSANTNGGLKVLCISFVNDIYNPEKDEDRNLWIGDARIE